MIDIYALSRETSLASVELPDSGDTEVVLIRVAVPVSAVPALLAEFDPSSGTSPLVAVSRPIARELLAELLRWSVDGAL